MGVSEEDIAKAQVQSGAAEQPLDYEVHEDCWDSVLLFLQLESQWELCNRMVPVGLGMGVVLVRNGLPTPRIESALRLKAVPRNQWAALFADLQVMERAVLMAEEEKRVGG